MKTYITPIFVFLLTIISTFAGDFVIERIDRVYDGDTITVTLVDVHPLFGEKIGIRVRGIDTPEVSRKSDLEEEAGRKVRDYVKWILDEAVSVNLENYSRDKYFRIVASVMIEFEDVSFDLSEELLYWGYAKAYDGGTKEAWTEEELRYILEN